GLLLHRAVTSDPVERVTQQELFKTVHSSLLEFPQRRNGSFHAGDLSGCLIEKCVSHRVMSISNREPNRMMKQSASRRNEGFKEDHGRNRHNAYLWLPIVESFGKATDRPGKKGLMVQRSFTEAIQPLGKTRDNG